MSASHLCPWWLAYTFDNPLRRLAHPVAKMFGPYLQPGQSALDVGCGMGYFSIGLAQLLGPEGRVYAVDRQAKMLKVLRKRAARAGVDQRIETRECQAHSLGIDDLQVEVALCFWMAHEVDDQPRLFSQLADALPPGGRLLLAEPRGHVTPEEFSQEIDCAARCGLRFEAEWPARMSRGAVLQKEPSPA